MKKKTAPKKTTVKKTVKRTVPQSSSSNQLVLFRRVVIISACLALILSVLITTNEDAVRSGVAGVKTMAGLYNQTTIPITPVPGATSYNIYYGQTGQNKFTNAVRNISPNVHSYTISDLGKNAFFRYQVSALKGGKEVNFSSIKPVPILQPM